MKQIYNVTVLIDASTSVSVEAESPQEAVELAEKAASEKGAGDLCHQCTDHTEAGDFIGAFVYDKDDNEVLDTTRTGELEAYIAAHVANIAKALGDNNLVNLHQVTPAILSRLAGLNSDKPKFTRQELDFFKLVVASPGAKLSSECFASGEADEPYALWENLEAAGLITCIGSYRWKPAVDVIELGVQAAVSAELAKLQPEQVVAQIREAMERRAARQQIAELHIGEAWLTVTYGGMKWHHWNMAGMGCLLYTSPSPRD